MSIDDDLVVVPAWPENFEKMFMLGEWKSIEIAEARIPYLKYIACYQVNPLSKITAYARIKDIAPSEIEEKKYNLSFDKPTLLTEPIPVGEQPFGQGRRYTSLQRFRNSKTLDDLFDFDE